jgi:glycosyltransferase involved in cell wall biosynthesis
LIPSLRVALFTDSYTEANGVATLSREFVAFARRKGIPFLNVHSGPTTRTLREGAVTTLELKRGFASFRLDHDLFCDPLLTRYKNRVLAEMRAFQPDLVQITGPGDIGILGVWIAHLLKVPCVASWHTNLHEYAGRRLETFFSFLPDVWREKLSRTAEKQSLRACMWFYHYGRFTFAPNQGMVNLLASRTGRPSFLMAHGVDTALFSPLRRTRDGGPFNVGYVGRLTPEKNVRMLAELEHALAGAGAGDFRMVMVGEGSEREWLRRHIKRAEFPGVLRGPALANAFADMDAFVFPSKTDTFGLVLLEAMSSGVPVVVSPETGARVGIAHGVNGFKIDTVGEAAQSVMWLMQNPTRQHEMSRAARDFACARAWDGVFSDVYRTYLTGLERVGKRKPEAAEVPVAQ